MWQGEEHAAAAADYYDVRAGIGAVLRTAHRQRADLSWIPTGGFLFFLFVAVLAVKPFSYEAEEPEPCP
jgi:hypothetical protein